MNRFIAHYHRIPYTVILTSAIISLRMPLLEVESQALCCFLRSLTPHTRATYVKLIHQWIPTYAFLHRQGR
jgi:hypothetical protein